MYTTRELRAMERTPCTCSPEAGKMLVWSAGEIERLRAIVEQQRHEWTEASDQIATLQATVAELQRLAIVDRPPDYADLLTRCADVIDDLLALRQGRPSAHLGDDRMRELLVAARDAAEKARAR